MTKSFPPLKILLHDLQALSTSKMDFLILLLNLFKSSVFGLLGHGGQRSKGAVEVLHNQVTSKLRRTMKPGGSIALKNGPKKVDPQLKYGSIRRD